jgi:hypothetical protein
MCLKRRPEHRWPPRVIVEGADGIRRVQSSCGPKNVPTGRSPHLPPKFRPLLRERAPRALTTSSTPLDAAAGWQELHYYGTERFNGKNIRPGERWNVLRVGASSKIYLLPRLICRTVRCKTQRRKQER